MADGALLEGPVSSRGRSGLRSLYLALIGALMWTLPPGTAFAQDLEPRRWAHIPIDTNVTGISYAHIEGKVAFDPVQVQEKMAELVQGLKKVRAEYGIS